MPNPLMFRLLLLAALATSAAIGLAGELDQHLSVGGLEIYYGFAPAEMVREASTHSPADAGMHDKKAVADDRQHLVVTLYDSQTQARITDAAVTAKVSTLSYRQEEKALTLMSGAGQPSYGNYFRIAGSDRYRVTLTILRPGSAAPVETSFEYRLPSTR